MKTLKNILTSMRPEQWTKNLIVFAGLFFGKGFTDISVLSRSIQAFLIFCLVSSGSYIINDIIDRRKDRFHPEKAKRPIARGSVSMPLAFAVAAVLISVGMLWALLLSDRLLVVVGLFLALHIAYDLLLKHISIIDVFTIAFAFILRLVGGVVMTPVFYSLSSWILLCTFLLALFLALCKRRSEVALLLDDSKHHRKSLAEYDIVFLNQMITIVSACVIICYSLYALSHGTPMKIGIDRFIYTIPFVVYGIFRYLYLVNMREGGSNPEKLLLKDIPLLTDILLYCLTVYVILYRP